jgi:hypothetical protein
MRCGGSETASRKPDNALVVEYEHPPEIASQHARSYPVPSFELARLFANGSGEVPLQVEIKTIL